MTPQEQLMAPPGVADAALSDSISQWQKLQAFLADPNNLLLAFLFFAGIVLKRSKRIKNEDIVWILPTAGFLLGATVFGFVTHQTHWVMGGMQGGIYGFIAIALHQLIKQKMPSIDTLLNGDPEVQAERQADKESLTTPPKTTAPDVTGMNL